MATAKPDTPVEPVPPASRRRGLANRRIAAGAGIVAAVLLGWYWKPLNSHAVAAASQGAHRACSCRFVAGRELDSCSQDFGAGMGLVMLSEDSEAKSVTARFPLLASQTAQFREGQGCVLERWAK